jgi:30S ribosomal protein S31
MGKGDQRTRRGKIYRGTHGKRRPKRTKVATSPVETAKPKKARSKSKK